MNNATYLRKLKKALSALENNEIDNICNEISSYAVDTEANLHASLGSPDVLAKQYLDGETLELPLAKKAIRFGRKLLTLIGVGLVTVIALAALIFWWLNKDDFNYADVSAPELTSADIRWEEAPMPLGMTLELKRSQIVVYWSADDSLRWHCAAESRAELTESVLSVSENKCYIFLPLQEHEINAEESKLVVVEPKANAKLNLKRVTLEFADNGNAYSHTVSGSRFRMSDEVVSDANAAITIETIAHETNIKKY